MIYISTSCVNNKKIKDSVFQLADVGFKNIELSGGTDFYDNFEDDLIDLKLKYDLNYICHNYFPPPKSHFVVNLASLDKSIFDKSIDHLCNSINLSKKLGATQFGFHAGFFLNIALNQIGEEISNQSLFKKEKAIESFCCGYNKLLELDSSINLYIENNVISNKNFLNFNNNNLFMLTNSYEFNQLKKKINFKLLLDVAHLKVSCKTLGLDFQHEFDLLINNSDYIHISDNDGYSDTNKSLDQNSSLLKMLSPS